jgi:hypothetical protein
VEALTEAIAAGEERRWYVRDVVVQRSAPGVLVVRGRVALTGTALVRVGDFAVEVRQGVLKGKIVRSNGEMLAEVEGELTSEGAVIRIVAPTGRQQRLHLRAPHGAATMERLREQLRDVVQ